MKKGIINVIALVMTALCIFVLGACNKGATIPEGYTNYDEGKITFAYPTEWTLSEGSVTQMIDSSTNNNITVAYETKSDVYSTMTVDSFNTLLKPSLNAMGITVLSPNVEQKNNGSIDIAVITYIASYAGKTMTQTIYALNASTRTYIVTVTEATPDVMLVSTVFDTLRVK